MPTRPSQRESATTISVRVLERRSDEELGSRLASGEAAAFDELYRRYAPRLRAYGTFLLGDAAAGEDVAHASLLKAYQALRLGQGPDRMKPWLYRIAHNAAIDTVRARQPVTTSEAEPQVGPDESTALRGSLVAALDALPERARTVFVLRELRGMRTREIAAELSITVSQVEQALFAARNKLAETLVFGVRIDCPTLRALAEGPLDHAEERVLRAHLRSCRPCRRELGRRRSGLLILPWLPLDRVWDLLSRRLGRHAVAKAAAIVGSGTIASGVAVALPSHVGRQVPATSVPAAVSPRSLADRATPRRVDVRAAARTAPANIATPAVRRQLAGSAGPVLPHLPATARPLAGPTRSHRSPGAQARAAALPTPLVTPAAAAPANRGDAGVEPPSEPAPESESEPEGDS